MSRQSILKKLASFTVLSLFAVGAWGSGFSIQKDNVEVKSAQSAMTISFLSEAYAWGGGGVAAKVEDLATTASDLGLASANSVIDILYILFTPFVTLAGWLLTPDWTFGEVFGFRPVLHQFWVMISNIVYVIFAFLLVGIAFMNIFGGSDSHWKIKAKLPKLIIGIVSVPFTWFLVSAVSSIAAILTASVLQLPYDMLKDTASINQRFEMPTKCSFDFTKKKESEAGSEKKEEKRFWCSEEKKMTTIGEMFTSKKAYGILNVYAYGIFKIQDFKGIDLKQLKGIQKTGDVIVGLAIAALFFIVFMLLIIALCFALFTRAFMFWMYAMFSPLFSLAYFFEWKLGGDSFKMGAQFSVGKLISLALVPVYVSAALAFGLVFISMARNLTIDVSNGQPNKGIVELNKCEGQGCQSMKLGDMTIEMKGIPAGIGGGNILLEDAKNLGFGLMGYLIINLLALAVLWMSVMAALRSNEVTKGAVDPIAKFGDSIGELMKSMPKYVPIIPAGKDKDGKMRYMGIGGLENLGSQMKAVVSNRATSVGSELGSKWWNAVADSLGLPADKMAKAASDMERNMQTLAHHAKDTTQQQQHLANFLNKSFALNDVSKDEAIASEKHRNGIVDAFVKITGIDQERFKTELAALRKITNASDFQTKLDELARNGASWSQGTALNVLDNGFKKPADNSGGSDTAPKSGLTVWTVPEDIGKRADTYSIPVKEGDLPETKVKVKIDEHNKVDASEWTLLPKEVKDALTERKVGPKT